MSKLALNSHKKIHRLYQLNAGPLETLIHKIKKELYVFLTYLKKLHLIPWKIRSFIELKVCKFQNAYNNVFYNKFTVLLKTFHIHPPNRRFIVRKLCMLLSVAYHRHPWVNHLPDRFVLLEISASFQCFLM